MADSENHPTTPTPDNERNGFISGDENNGRKALSRSNTKSATHPAVKHQTANNKSCQVFSKFPPISTNAVRAMCGWPEVGPILAVADIAAAVIATRRTLIEPLLS